MGDGRGGFVWVGRDLRLDSYLITDHVSTSNTCVAPGGSETATLPHLHVLASTNTWLHLSSSLTPPYET